MASSNSPSDLNSLESYFYVALHWRGRGDKRVILTVGAALQLLSNAEVGLDPERPLYKRIKELKGIIILGRHAARKSPPDRQVKKFKRS